MQKEIKIHEKFLYEIWKNQEFASTLISKEGDQISVIEPGVENHVLGGPDFINARIRIGNITYLGDIEIDNSYYDWKAHGHDLNNRFNRVILHIVVNGNSDQNFVLTREGRKVPTVPIGKFLSGDIKDSIREAIISERDSRLNKIRCIELNKLLSDKDKLDYLYHLGIIRFKNKCAKMFERLKEIAYLKEMNIKEPVIRYELDQKFYEKKFTPEDFNDEDLWHQLIYEQIFEALGYSNNKEIMIRLAKAANISMFRKFEAEPDAQFLFEAVLIKVSGLIPNQVTFEDEETAEYLRKIGAVWNSVKNSYDNIIFRKTQWHFDKQRPHNFPTIRIAGGARILYRMLKEDLIKNIIKSFGTYERNEDLNDAIRDMLLVKGDGYWKNHFVFDKKSDEKSRYFVGYSRVDEIYSNIILPILAVYFEVFDKEENLNRVFKLYSKFRHTAENSIVNQISTALMLSDAHKRSVLYQGMLELFRTYCSRELCLECKLGKMIYN
jgi:hypothetical protein